MAGKTPILQPPFDSRIYKLTYPLQGGNSPTQGLLKHGHMVWESPLTGYSGLAKVHFLYNPSTVEADYPIADTSAAAALQFPNPGDKADLRVPLQQTASWSLLYDRTYELWGSYDDGGNPRHNIGKDSNNPKVVGVLADIIQMQQFTGMLVSASTPGATQNPGGASNNISGHQGIIQIVPCYVFFSDKFNLSFYGYISEWDVQVTHWTNFMVPMRCVISITFTMLPPIQTTPNPSSRDLNYVASQITRTHVPGNSAINAASPGISGR